MHYLGKPKKSSKETASNKSPYRFAEQFTTFCQFDFTLMFLLFKLLHIGWQLREKPGCVSQRPTHSVVGGSGSKGCQRSGVSLPKMGPSHIAGFELSPSARKNEGEMLDR